MVSILFSLVFTLNSYASTFVSLSADQPLYVAGHKAVLLASVVSPPANPALELYFEAKLNGQPIKAFRLSDVNALSITPMLAEGENQDWEVDVYWQRKSIAKPLEKSVLFYRLQEIPRLQGLLRTETDPDQLAVLQQELEKDQAILAGSEDSLAQERTLVEVDYLSFNVAAAPVEAKKPASTMTLSLDHSSYTAGQIAILTTQLNTSFPGKEDIVQVDLDGQALRAFFVGGVYKTYSPALTSGQHTFHVAYKVRPKAQANLLRGAIKGATATRDADSKLLAKETDPLEQLYLQNEIGNLNLAIAGVTGQLEDILQTAGVGHAGISVN